ncbi:hypothetical protein [Streptomyces spongiae]|uniref:Uncharacterized protein n=1 Tax=Streptomyces spongiae TaxID=565072 RepID=A0A5N8XB49_9ACTN|nr:hypothetical protein [Streptomyces spongiae]MPY56366.1 hypothetical protein [Streptomyces spongiae]
MIAVSVTLRGPGTESDPEPLFQPSPTNCGQYGPLASFIVDLDPDCSEVVIRLTYALKDGALDVFLSDLVSSADAAPLERLARRIPAYFGLSVTAVDPTDDANVRTVDLADVKKLLKVDFL